MDDGGEAQVVDAEGDEEDPTKEDLRDVSRNC
jgi:hypothetical protein